MISIVIAIKSDIESVKEKNLQNLIFRGRTRSHSTISNSIIHKHSKTYQMEQNEDLTGVYLKIFTNYFQIISSIATFNLSVPQGVVEFPSSVGQPIQKTINSLDCVLKDQNSSMPIIYLRFVFSLVMPFIYLAVFILGLVIYKFVKKINFPFYMIYTALIFLLIYVQPDLIAQMIALLSCRKIGNHSYILSNVNYECYTNDYYNWGLFFIFPTLLAYSLFFPLLLFFILRKNKENLTELKIKLKFGFLYKEYTQKCFYWEFFKMAEKISIILILNFYSQDIKTKGILVFIAITLYAIGSIIKTPYINQYVNKLDQQSTMICAISVLLGVFLYENNFNYFVYIAFTIIIALNVWFILMMAGKIIRGYTKKIDQLIQDILEGLGHKFKFISDYLNKKKLPISKLDPKIKNKVRNVLIELAQMEEKARNQKLLNIKIQILEKQFGVTYKKEFNKLNKEQDQSILNMSINKNLEDDFNLENQLDNNKQSQDSEYYQSSTNAIFAAPTMKVFQGSKTELIEIKNRINTKLNQDSPQYDVVPEEQEQMSILDIEKIKHQTDKVQTSQLKKQFKSNIEMNIIKSDEGLRLENFVEQLDIMDQNQQQLNEINKQQIIKNQSTYYQQENLKQITILDDMQPKQTQKNLLNQKFLSTDLTKEGQVGNESLKQETKIALIRQPSYQNQIN